MSDNKIEEYKKIIETVRILRENKQTPKTYNTFDYCIFVVTLMCFMVVLYKLLPSGYNKRCMCNSMCNNTPNTPNGMHIPNGMNTIRNPIQKKCMCRSNNYLNNSSNNEHYTQYNQMYQLLKN